MYCKYASWCSPQKIENSVGQCKLFTEYRCLFVIRYSLFSFNFFLAYYTNAGAYMGQFGKSVNYCSWSDAVFVEKY